MKDLSKEEMAARPDLVVALAQKIQDIPDGVTVGRRGGTWGAKAGASKPVEIKVDAMHPGKKEATVKDKQEFCTVAGNPKPAPILLLHGWKTNCGNADWYICSIDDLMRPEHYEQTEESLGFKQEYEARRAKQV